MSNVNTSLSLFISLGKARHCVSPYERWELGTVYFTDREKQKTKQKPKKQNGLKLFIKPPTTDFFVFPAAYGRQNTDEYPFQECENPEDIEWFFLMTSG